MDVDRFEWLMAGLTENTLDGDEQLELAGMLDSSPGLVLQLQDDLATDSLLVQLAQNDSAQFRERLLNAMNASGRTGQDAGDLLLSDLANAGSAAGGSGSGRFLPWVLTAILLVSTTVLAAILVQQRDDQVTLPVADRQVPREPTVELTSDSVVDPDPAGNPDPALAGRQPVLCRVLNAAGVFDDMGHELKNSTITPGTYLTRDIATGLQFGSGIQIALRGPARFELIDNQNLRLHSGAARIVVPRRQSGFTVHVPGGRFENDGTEFGISVDAASGCSEVLAFEGNVAIFSSRGEKVDTAHEGVAVRMNPKGLLHQIAADPSRYLVPSEIRFINWSLASLNLAADPDLLVYFPWRDSQKIPGQPAPPLTNAAVRHGISAPEVHGTRIVSGRWHGKEGILFDNSSDYVQIDLTRPMTQLTIATWVNIDRLDYSMNSIFNSNGWSEGNVHLQITRTGHVWTGVFGDNEERTLTQEISVGQWHHIVTTVDCESHQRRVYIDGKLASEGPVPESVQSLQLGKCRIGNWLPSDDVVVTRDRALRGRMDEFGLWQRILDEKEISELWVSGNPYPAD